MCGIAGYVGTAEVSGDAMLAALHHRGPDDAGLWRHRLSPEVSLTLAHTRLRILDLSDKAAQPMRLDEERRLQPVADSGESRCVLVYNGEIYNFRALREELAGRGHRFESSGDTEVLARGFGEWGMALFPRLDGMFALALYDRVQQRLVLARDPLGIKPLYYSRTSDGGFGFASETRTLLKTGIAEPVLDESAMVDYLETGGVRDPATLYRQIRSLPSGHVAVIDLAAGQPAPLVLHRYWSPEVVAGGETLPESEWKALHRQRLAESVRLHLESDVPVGVFLSGGIDSTLLLEQAVQAGGSGRLSAFTLGGGVTEHDESETARRTAERLGVSHRTVALSSNERDAWVREALNAFDLPSADGINLALVARAAQAGGLRVALSGTGADELHGDYGHPRRLARLARVFAADDGSRNVLGDGVVAASRWLADPTRSERIASLLDHLDSAEEMMLEKRRYFTRTEILTLYPPGNEWLHPGRRRRLVANREALRTLGLREQIRTADVAGYLKNTLLRDGDAVTMARGLEMRVPFLGRSYVDCVLAAPERYTAAESVRKPRLIEMLSAESRALARHPKSGFNVDYARLLTGALKPVFIDAIATLNTRAGFAADGETLLASLSRSGRDANRRRARRLWALLSLGVCLAK